jgi:Tfp pilus assembly protein PilF
LDGRALFSGSGAGQTSLNGYNEASLLRLAHTIGVNLQRADNLVTSLENQLSCQKRMNQNRIFLLLALLAFQAGAAEPGTKTPATTAATNSITAPDGTNAVVEKEYEALLAKDDEAQAEVDKWIQENNQFRAKGVGVPDAELNRKIFQRFEPVRKAYEDFIKQYPSHARARLAYGGFLNDSEDEAGAQTQWEKALELDPTNPAAYNNLAARYTESGREDKGFEYFTKAIQLKPDEALYYNNFGDALYVFRKKAVEYYKLDEQQVFARALGLYSNAARLEPKKFLFASRVADTYYAIKPFPAEQALKAWTNALQLTATDVEREGVYVHLARGKMLAGRLAEARAQLNAVTNAAFSEIKSELLKNIAEREMETTQTNNVNKATK